MFPGSSLPTSELCGNTAIFAKSMAMLGNSEDNTALSRALSQLAEVEDKMEQLHQEQAASDFFILAELLADYIRLLGAVRVSWALRRVVNNVRKSLKVDFDLKPYAKLIQQRKHLEY